MEQEIVKLKDEIVIAIKEKNIRASLAVFAAQTVMFLLSPPLRFKTGDNSPGQDGIKEWFDSFEGPIELSYQELEVTTESNVAFCHSLDHLRGKRIDGTFTDVWYRETLGFRRINGEWKVTHQHQSFPMYMDGSKKSANDLKP